jgi:sporulation-control protein spo0M
MRTDSALPGLFMLLALAGIAIFAVTCSSCAPSEAFPFRGEFGYVPSTGQFDVQLRSSK